MWICFRLGEVKAEFEALHVLALLCLLVWKEYTQVRSKLDGCTQQQSVVLIVAVQLEKLESLIIWRPMIGILFLISTNHFVISFFGVFAVWDGQSLLYVCPDFIVQQRCDTW